MDPRRGAAGGDLEAEFYGIGRMLPPAPCCDWTLNFLAKIKLRKKSNKLGTSLN
jgi:hypothetical protein